jgi:hypothetical protein
MAAVLFAAALLVAGACNHAWDALEPLSTHCGGTNLLSWDFSAPQPDVFNSDPEATLVGGKGVFTLPAAALNATTVQLSTLRLYNLVGDRVYLEVDQIPNQAQGASAALDLRYVDGDDIFFAVDQGMLQCGFDHGGHRSLPMSTPYDATTQHYWQIRESQGTIYCETSPDGTTWSPAGSFDVAQSDLATPSGLGVLIAASTPAGMAAPGVFEIDNLNGGLPPTGVWCPALSYTDDFPATGPVPGPAWIRSYITDPKDSYDQAGGTLNLHFGADASTGLGYESSVAYNMTGQRVSLQVLSLVTLAEGTAFFVVSNDTNANVYWDMHSDGFSCVYDADGQSGTIWQGEAPALPAWVGLRESGGRVYCEIYQNGSWTSHGSTAGALDATRADITLGASAGMPGSFLGKFAHYNLGPQ